MILRGIDFGPAMDASGVRGFFGEGYRHHRLLGPFGPTFHGCTFVAKTTTLNPNPGNMRLKKDGVTPKEWFPKCIKAYFWKQMMLNAVGLSGPGAKFLLAAGRWQTRTDPFFLSFMAISNTPAERLAELRDFIYLLAHVMPDFLATFGLQINYSCPNVGLNPEPLVNEVGKGLDIAGQLGIPLMPKFGVLMPVEAIIEISRHPSCDAICISNSIPWGKLPEKINWKKLFGTDISPLATFGGGALSGAPLFPILLEYLKGVGIEKPINACGGIIAPNDVNLLVSLADSIAVGSVSTLRPWNTQPIIDRAHQLF